MADRHHRAPDHARARSTAASCSISSPQGRGLGHRPALRVRPRHRRHQQGQESRPDLAVDGDPFGPRSQFTSWAFTENVRRLGLISSMGTVGDCYDNAPMESFWGSMQIELLNRQSWRTNLEFAVAIADYIENFYNPDPAPQRSELPDPDRIRRPTLNPHPPGRFVITSSPPKWGQGPYGHPQRDSNPCCRRERAVS